MNDNETTGKVALATKLSAKSSTVAKVAGAVKSVLKNPLVQQAITAFVLKRLAGRK